MTRWAKKDHIPAPSNSKPSSPVSSLTKQSKQNKKTRTPTPQSSPLQSPPLNPITMSTNAIGCPITTDPTRSAFCRNTAAAAHLKLLSLAVILLTSAAGISALVVLSRLFKNTPSYSTALTLIKSFAAGVILSTSLVHVLPDAFAALSDCHVASRHPWRDFPFSGLVTLIGSLLALLVDVAASHHVEEKAAGSNSSRSKSNYVRIEKAGCHVARDELAAAAAEEEQEQGMEDMEMEMVEEGRLARLKQRMVSQVLEIGIIFHSVIIRVTMGMSQNQCSIRPLVVALAFHQVFEGMGLGGCIAQMMKMTGLRVIGLNYGVQETNTRLQNLNPFKTITMHAWKCNYDGEKTSGS